MTNCFNFGSDFFFSLKKNAFINGFPTFFKALNGIDMQNSLWEFAEFVVLFDHSICMGGKNRDWLLKTALFCARAS